jgi:hypothetical protein
MSWQTFKDNILKLSNSPESINDIDLVAKTYATEYDAAIKRGKDSLHQISLQKGNVEAMTQLFKAALQKGETSTAPYDLVGEMGKGVIVYWSGATMNNFPTPIIPAPGAVSNISVVSNMVVNPGQWTPPSPAAAAAISNDDTQSPYDKLDWNEIPLDKNDPDVQEIINPDSEKINEEIIQSDLVIAGDDESGSIITEMDNTKAEIIDKALYDQNILSEEKLPPAKKLENDIALKSGYKNLDELLKKAGAWGPKLGKNRRISYENLRIGFNSDIHGLCPQGTQAVVVALTGVKGLGTLSGNADWFSFKNPSTGGGRSSFATNVGGKSYYNDKINVGDEYTLDSSKWQVGDIIVMGYNDKKYGHIQVWTGWKWVSDFTQNKIQANWVDKSSIALWRLNENGKTAVTSEKNKTA